MDKPISVGDLVVVYRPMPCCGEMKSVGLVFVVGEIYMEQKQFCCYCGKLFSSDAVTGKSDGKLTILDRLKRIPPLSELDSIKTTEEVFG